MFEASVQQDTSNNDININNTSYIKERELLMEQ
jgi:hypothetical protein